MSTVTKPLPNRSDYRWTLVTALCASLLIFDLGPSVLDGHVALGQGVGAGAYAGLLIWLGLGAWRRTVWGCPDRGGLGWAVSGTRLSVRG